MQKFLGGPDENRTKMIGLKLRLARQAAGLSQSKLGEGLGVSFQQVQKYERGASRLSVNALERSCAILGITPAALLADGPLDQAVFEMTGTKGAQDTLSAETAEVAAAFFKISSAPLRRSIRELVMTISRSETAR